MVKQRMPRGPRPARKGPFHQNGADAPQADARTEAAVPSLAVAEADIAPSAAETLHEMLLESVSPGPLQGQPAAAPAEVAGAHDDTHGVAEPHAEAVPAPGEPEPPADFAPASEAALPVASIPEPARGEELSPVELEAPTAVAATVVPRPAERPPLRLRLTPEAMDVGGINATLLAFVRSESAAALAHLQALGAAKSPADMIRLQVGEIQRAADASLTCWVDVARRASRIVEMRRS